MTTDARATEIAALIARLATLMAEPPYREPIMPEQHSRAMPERVLLTVKEAAGQLGIGPTKTYALIKSGELESVTIGRLRRIHIDAINTYAAHLVSQQATKRK